MQLQQNLQRLEQQSYMAGLDPALGEPRENFFMKALNFIDKPKQMVMGVLDSAFLRGDIGDIGITGAINRGLDERINAFDILRRETDMNPILRGVLGFGAEMVLDPLSWMSLGTKGMVRAGRALSETGEQVVRSFADDLARTGIDGFTASQVVDDAIVGARRIGGLRKELKLAEGTAAYASTAAKLADAEKMANPLFQFGKLSLDNVDDMFSKKSLNFGMGLPFLGHFQKGAEYRKLEGSAVRKALQTASNIVKPGSIDLGSIPLDKAGEALQAFSRTTGVDALYQGVKGVAEAGLQRFKAGMDTLEAVPVAGSVVRGGKATKAALDKMGESFKATFMQKAFLGEDAANAKADAIAYIAGAGPRADYDVQKMFPELIPAHIDEITSPKFLANQEHAKQAALAIDEQVRPLLAQLSDEEITPLIQKLRNGDDILNELNGIGRIDEINEIIEGNLQRAMKAQQNPEVADMMGRMLEHFRVLKEQEKAVGLKGGILQAYLPHMYTNLKRGAAKGPGAKTWQKSRKFDKLSDAIEAGLDPDLDIANLLHTRTLQSYRAQEGQKYLHRMIIEHGLPEDVYLKLAKEAETNPAAAALIEHKRMELPEFVAIDKTRQAEIRSQAKGQADAVNDMLIEEVAAETGWGFANKVKQLTQTEDAQTFSTKVAQLALDANIEYNNQLDRLFKSFNLRPKDAIKVRPGEAADVFEHAGKRFVLPKPIARAYRETTQRRDALRAMFPDSKGFQAAVDFLDASTNFMKSTTTLPFPSYWLRNLYGGQLQAAAQVGINIMDTGSIADTLNHLRPAPGTSPSFLTKAGFTWTPEDTKKMIRMLGIRYTADDHIDMIRTAGRLNLEKSITDAQNFKEALKRKSVPQAYRAATSFMQENFDNFFRVNLALQHVKNGHGMADAVRLTNEALLDYRNLTDVERSFFRRAFMFYNWTSKSTKQALVQAVTNPGALQMQLKGAHAVAEAFSAPDAAPTIDDFEASTLDSLSSLEQISFPLGKDKEGKPITARGFGLPLNTLMEQFSVFVPRNYSFKELTDTMDDSATRTLQKIASGSNPYLKAVIEGGLTKKNLYFDAPLDSKFLRRVPSFEAAAKQIAPHAHNKIPQAVWSALDAPAKKLLQGRPDGEGNYIADPGMYYLFVNVIPGISRLNATAKAALDPETTAGQKMIELFSGTKIETQDTERTMGYTRQKVLRDNLMRYGIQ